MEKYQREGIEIEICQKSNLFYVTTNLNTLSTTITLKYNTNAPNTID